jgi:hypothetical protein
LPEQFDHGFRPIRPRQQTSHQRQVRAGAERLARAPQAQHRHVLPLLDLLQHGVEAVHEGLVDRIHRRPVDTAVATPSAAQVRRSSPTSPALLPST